MYVDSSVILELVFGERKVIFPDLSNGAKKYTSRLTQVEVMRTTMKQIPKFASLAAEILMQFEFVEISDQILNHATFYPHEISLKSSDAIHMATAEHLLDVDDVLLTYDKQMALNADRLGIKVLTAL
jgi:predicted nucleic acid-binding protein